MVLQLERIFKCKYCLILIVLISTNSIAATWSGFAVPTRVDIVRNDGFMIYGDFGNAAECDVANQIFVRMDHPQYDAIYSSALAAMMSKSEIQAFIHACELVSWYSLTKSHNTLYSYSTFNIRS